MVISFNIVDFVPWNISSSELFIHRFYKYSNDIQRKPMICSSWILPPTYVDRVAWMFSCSEPSTCQPVEWKQPV